MAYRVAVASSDGKVINQHFGRSRQFIIFDIDGQESYSFVEIRQNIPPCGLEQHEENAMERTVNLLSDCKAVLVSQIGAGAEQALAARGIQAYCIRDFIDGALSKLAEFSGRKRAL